MDAEPHVRQRGGAARQESATSKLRRATRGLGEVLAPEDADEPILAPVARAALFEWLNELGAAEELKQAGLKPRTTALLHGPPGCGKTTLVHHLAARLGLPMLTVGAESLFDSAFGASERNMAKLFDAVEASEVRCVLFLDEIDAIGVKRQEDRGGGATHARGAMLTVMLRRMEHWDGGLMAAATNRPEALDTALWRRFGLQVAIDLPGDDERFAILRRYLHPWSLPEDDVDRICALTDGASPALLRGVAEGIKRALVLGARMGWEINDPVAVLARIVAGLRPPPEIEPPPLWEGRDVMRKGLAGLSWPPVRGV